MAYLVDAYFFTVPHGWRWMFGLGAIPAIIQLLLSFTLPESPRFDILHGNFHRARQTLALAYPDSDAHSLDARITKFRDQITRERHQGASIREASTLELLSKLWKDDGNRRALTVACGLQLFQQVLFEYFHIRLPYNPLILPPS